MERYRPIPEIQPIIEQEYPKNPPIEALAQDESTMYMSERELQDREWQEQKELNRMRNMQIYTGWHPKRKQYIYKGMGQ